MVETGFPTSLVDLIVKNRSRFKKKKKQPPMADDPLIISPLPLPSPPLPPPPSPENSQASPLTLPPRASSSIERWIDDEVYPLIREGEGEIGNSGDCNVEMNRGLIAIFKMFLVVLLVLGTEKLVVGITLSAFLLLFLEYLGECLLFKPFWRVLLMLQRFSKFFNAKMVKLEEEDCVFKAPLRQDQFLRPVYSDIGCQIEEIEVVDAPNVEKGQCVKGKIDECSCDGKSNCEGVDREGFEFRCELAESKEKQSHRSKMKSKIKKLVPKKFRKKKGVELENGVSLNGVNDLILEEMKELEVYSESKLKSHGIVSSVASGIDHKTNIHEVVGSVGESSEGLTDGSVRESSKGIDKEALVGKDGSTEREHNSMYIVLLLVVLVGLIGGRVIALVFTLTWCLMSKGGEGIRGYAKLPVIRFLS